MKMDAFGGLLNDKFGGAGAGAAPPGGDMGGGMPEMPEMGGTESVPDVDTSGTVNWDEMPSSDAAAMAIDGLKVVLGKLPKGDVSARLGQIISDGESLIGDIAQAEGAPGAEAEVEIEAPTDEGLSEGEKPPEEVDLSVKEEKKKGPQDQFDLGIMPA